MLSIDLKHYLFVSALLFLCGLIGMISRKNRIFTLISIQLIFSAAAINFVAFSKYIASDLSGQIFSLFILATTLLETVVALMMIYSLFRKGDFEC